MNPSYRVSSSWGAKPHQYSPRKESYLDLTAICYTGDTPGNFFFLTPTRLWIHIRLNPFHHGYGNRWSSVSGRLAQNNCKHHLYIFPMRSLHTISRLTTSKGWSTILSIIGLYFSAQLLKYAPGDQRGTNLKAGRNSIQNLPGTCAALRADMADSAVRMYSSRMSVMSMLYVIFKIIAEYILEDNPCQSNITTKSHAGKAYNRMCWLNWLGLFNARWRNARHCWSWMGR